MMHVSGLMLGSGDKSRRTSRGCSTVGTELAAECQPGNMCSCVGRGLPLVVWQPDEPYGRSGRRLHEYPYRLPSARLQCTRQGCRHSGSAAAVKASALVVLAVLTALVTDCLPPPPTTGPTADVPTAAQASPAAASTEAAPVAPPATAAPSSVAQWAPAPRTKASGCTSVGGLPDPACTPGAVDPRVTQNNISATICKRGYSTSVRPAETRR